MVSQKTLTKVKNVKAKLRKPMTDEAYEMLDKPAGIVAAQGYLTLPLLLLMRHLLVRKDSSLHDALDMFQTLIIMIRSLVMDTDSQQTKQAMGTIE